MSLGVRFVVLFCWFLLVILAQGLSVEVFSLRDSTNDQAVRRSCSQRLIAVAKAYPHLSQEIVSLFNSELGYTLVGVKPVSFYDEWSSINPQLIPLLEEAFSQSRDLIFKVTSCGREKKEICLIHRKCFQKCVHENASLRSFLEDHFSSSEGFLDLFRLSPLSLGDFCNNDDIAIGTMLGFGAQNASIWSRWSTLSRFLGIWNLKLIPAEISPGMIPIRYPAVRIPYFLKIPSLQPPFPSLYAEWRFLHKKKRFVKELGPPFRLSVPAFLYWEGNEAAVQRLMKGRDALGMVLFQLDSGDNL